MPPLMDYIEDRDLWKFALPNTKEIMMSVFSYDLSFESIDSLMNFTRTEINKRLVLEGQTLMRKYEIDLSKIMRSATREMPIGGYSIPCCNCNSLFASEAGNRLSVDRPFAATYYDTEKKRIFSLRSNDKGLDVSEIAKSYGGGGHRNASGFVVDRNHELAKL
jgi:oligoribonuclease NrnB/cAMP/cGMP phosphodiesterase (DHH superfamily)